jgi:DNA-binding XRE family transcriptional regulator
VAKRIGILRTTLVAIEKGPRRVMASEFIQMAGMYGRSMSELVSQRSKKEPFVPRFRLPPGQHSVTGLQLMAAATELDTLARDYLELEEMHVRPSIRNFLKPYALEVPGAKISEAIFQAAQGRLAMLPGDRLA